MSSDLNSSIFFQELNQPFNMLPTNHSASEPSFYKCEVCHEPVSNPLCPICLTEEIEVWSSYYPNLRKELIPRIKKYIESNISIPESSTICIKCTNDRSSICPYCFTNYVLEELEGLNSSRLILKEFLQFFNFDFEHTEFTKKAEELGVI